ncbi:phosphopantetheine-binding protein [Methylobacterium sp. L1A1]|uniref:phosphopantetheine-binding protein n=1 Tax=Methylorubrum sp. POS3 TaxID=2998492 RepID=UPI0010F60A48|nr:phosphopantetheine-binding protein [Methylobacterium sp. L1A1]
MSETMTQTVANRTMGLAYEIASRHAIKPEFGPGDALVDVGLSSLDLVNLMIAVEAEFDIMIPPTALTPKNFYSIETIAHMVETVRAAPSA